MSTQGAKRKRGQGKTEREKESAKLADALARVGIERGRWYAGWRQKYSCGRFNQSYCVMFTNDDELYVQPYVLTSVEHIDPVRSVAKYGPLAAATCAPMTRGLYKFRVLAPRPPKYSWQSTAPLLYVSATLRMHPACPHDVDSRWPPWRPSGSDAAIYCEFGAPQYPLKVSASLAEEYEDHRSCD